MQHNATSQKKLQQVCAAAALQLTRALVLRCAGTCVASIQQSGSITTPHTAILVTMEPQPQQPRPPSLGLNTALLSLHTRHETARLVRTSWSIFRSPSALTTN